MEGGTFISQSKYYEEVLKKFGICYILAEYYLIK